AVPRNGILRLRAAPTGAAGRRAGRAHGRAGRRGAAAGRGHRCRGQRRPAPPGAAGRGRADGLMRAIEPWVEPPLAEFLRESSARLVLLMTSSGQVVAQHGFTRSLDVLAVAALRAGIVASTREIARVMSLPSLGIVVHQTGEGRMSPAPFVIPDATWIV